MVEEIAGILWGISEELECKGRNHFEESKRLSLFLKKLSVFTMQNAIIFLKFHERHYRK